MLPPTFVFDEEALPRSLVGGSLPGLEQDVHESALHDHRVRRVEAVAVNVSDGVSPGQLVDAQVVPALGGVGGGREQQALDGDAEAAARLVPEAPHAQLVGRVLARVVGAVDVALRVDDAHRLAVAVRVYWETCGEKTCLVLHARRHEIMQSCSGLFGDTTCDAFSLDASSVPQRLCATQWVLHCRANLELSVGSRFGPSEGATRSRPANDLRRRLFQG